jgi:hypothetical protein
LLNLLYNYLFIIFFILEKFQLHIRKFAQSYDKCNFLQSNKLQITCVTTAPADRLHKVTRFH